MENANNISEVSPISIDCFSLSNSIGIPLYLACGKSMTSPASAVWPSANRAILIPFHIDAPMTVQKLYCYNGATASGNIDMGIFAKDGTRLVSNGATAQSGTSVLQVLDITDTRLVPDTYYIGLACDNVTATFFSTTSGALGITKTLGMCEMASAYVLPANITVATVSSDYIPHIGLIGRSSI